MRASLISLGAVVLAGCAGQLEDVGRAPELSPVGYGLAVQQPTVYPVNTFSQGTVKDYNSLWASGRDNFFADPRAKKIGDVLTVTIQINDRANLDNSSDRRRTSDLGIGGSLETEWDGVSSGGSADFGLDSGSGSRGSGSIDRSEEIQLSVAAVVTERLPNGNLVIAGSQEVRVNYEMRILQIAGIVRPRDIQANNTIPYDKIAEARVSYGGRGRISEVQQPGWGQQIYDIVTPF